MAVATGDRVALYLQDKHPIRDGMRYAQLAEQCGFEAVWQAESRLVREATVPMAAFAAVTERIGIGSGVVNTWTRNVGLLAATFSTLDDLAPGRIKLGLGAWWDPLAAKVGIRRRRHVQAMRETVDVTRRLLAMERVTFHGEFVDVDDIEIDIVHGDRSPKHVPIYIAATTGMKMMELAGEIGDGVLLNYLVGPGYNREAMAHLAPAPSVAAARSKTSTGRSSSSARWTRTGRSPSTGRGSSSRSTSGSSRTSARPAASIRRCSRRSGGSSPGRPPRRRSSRRWASCPTTSSS